MKRDELSALMAFAVIVEEGNFGRAGARLGLSASALSHILRGLEERLSVKLLHRTTRSFSPTDAGKIILEKLRPALAEIEGALDTVGEYRDSPKGHVRICTHRMGAMSIIAPKLRQLRTTYPDVLLEITIEDGLCDIVSAGFDAGVRPGEMLPRDMVAIRIGPPTIPVIVGSPLYFENHPIPQTPEELALHKCIAYRQISTGKVDRWRFEKEGRAVSVAIDAGFISSDVELMARAALEGVGIALVLQNHVHRELADGSLISVLQDWTVPYVGNFLYYPSNRHISLALRAVIDTLKYKGE
jgi:DNA-binding transcriptional LysR family regulator